MPTVNTWTSLFQGGIIAGPYKLADGRHIVVGQYSQKSGSTAAGNASGDPVYFQGAFCTAGSDPYNPANYSTTGVSSGVNLSSSTFQLGKNGAFPAMGVYATAFAPDGTWWIVWEESGNYFKASSIGCIPGNSGLGTSVQQWATTGSISKGNPSIIGFYPAIGSTVSQHANCVVAGAASGGLNVAWIPYTAGATTSGGGGGAIAPPSGATNSSAQYTSGWVGKNGDVHIVAFYENLLHHFRLAGNLNSSNQATAGFALIASRTQEFTQNHPWTPVSGQAPRCARGQQTVFNGNQKTVSATVHIALVDNSSSTLCRVLRTTDDGSTTPTLTYQTIGSESATNGDRVYQGVLGTAQFVAYLRTSDYAFRYVVNTTEADWSTLTPASISGAPTSNTNIQYSMEGVGTQSGSDYGNVVVITPGTSGSPTSTTYSFALTAGGGGTSYTRSASDTVTLGDAAGRSAMSYSRSASNTVTVTDAAARALAASRQAADAIAVGDTASGAASSAPHTANDTAGLTDTATRGAVSYTRPAADGVVLAEFASRAGAYTRTVSSTLVASDTATRSGAPQVSVGEGVVLSDGASRALSAARTATTVLVLAEAAARKTTVTSQISESLTIADAASPPAVSWARAVAAALVLADTADITASQVTSRALDAVTLSSSVTRHAAHGRTASNVITLVDTLAGVTSKVVLPTPVRIAGRQARRPGRVVAGVRRITRDWEG